MPRPRFDKLPPEQQRAILRAALEEFSEHGFADASLNRIIDAAGISKGSMYYYFDGKDDLYAHVARVQLDRMVEAVGPFTVPTTRDPDAFWATLEDYCVRIMRALASSPQLAAMTRGWVAAASNPALQRAQKEMEGAVLPWVEQALVAGQRARAVRKDVPMSLLIAVLFGMGQAMDMWLLAQELEAKALTKFVRVFVSMIRNALAPQGERT